VAENKPEARRDVEEQEAGDPHCNKAEVVPKPREEILRNSARKIADSGMPADYHPVLRNAYRGTKS
jgi:hypothetical protein